jgi:hypothetical protein
MVDANVFLVITDNKGILAVKNIDKNDHILQSIITALRPDILSNDSNIDEKVFFNDVIVYRIDE